MHRDDLIWIRHMLDAAKEALSFAKNKSRGDLDSDRMLAKKRGVRQRKYGIFSSYS